MEKRFYIRKVNVYFAKNKPHLHLELEGKYISKNYLKKLFKHYSFYINFPARCYDNDEPIYWLVYSEKENMKYIHNDILGDNFVKLNSFMDLNLLKYFISIPQE